MKKALLANSLYYPNVGGVENSLRAINKVLVEAGWHVDILASDNDQSSQVPLEPLSKTGIETIHRYSYRGALGPLSQVKNAKKKIKEINPSGNYDLVIARSQVAVLAAWLAGVKNINYVIPAVSAYQNKSLFDQANLARKINFTISSILQRIALSKADKNFVFSLEMRDQVSRFTKEKVAVELVFPGVDKDRFHDPDGNLRVEHRKRMGFSDDDIVLLCLGRFNKVKGFEYAIESLEYLDERYKLVIVGEGGEKKNYLKVAKEHKLEARVLFFDKTTRPEEFYWSSDVFLLSSLHEPFGQVLLEATASGLPVAAFNKKAEVNTATEEIYTSNPELIRFASEMSGKALSVAAAEAYKAKACFQEDFEHSRQGFLSQYSWKSMVEVLYGSKI